MLNLQKRAILLIWCFLSAFVFCCPVFAADIGKPQVTKQRLEQIHKKIEERSRKDEKWEAWRKERRDLLLQATKENRQSVYYHDREITLEDLKNWVNKEKAQHDIILSEIEYEKELLDTCHLYQLPKTEAEKALSYLMNSNVGRCVFAQDFIKKDNCAWSQGLLTDNFVKSVQRSAAKNCLFEKREEGEYCMTSYEGYDMMLCDDSMGYVHDEIFYYRTVSLNEKESIIKVVGKNLHLYGHKYRAIKENDKWKLDVIDCGYGWNSVFGAK